MTPTEHWRSLPVDLRLCLIWLGLVETDSLTGEVRVSPEAGPKLHKFARLATVTIPRVEAEPEEDLVGPLEEMARRIDLQKAFGVPKEAVRLPRKSKGLVRNRLGKAARP
jgi:hypothetical protein